MLKKMLRNSFSHTTMKSKNAINQLSNQNLIKVNILVGFLEIIQPCLLVAFLSPIELIEGM